MRELTDKEKEEAQKTMDHLLQYFWYKIEIKMESVSFEVAIQELIQEITEDA